MNNKTLHNVQIEGRLTKDPQAKATKNEKLLCEISLAYNTFWKTDSEGSTANYLTVVSYDTLAKEFLEKTKKGMKIIVVGELVQQRWKDKDNKSRENFRLIARDFLVSDLKNRPQVVDNLEKAALGKDYQQAVA